MIKEITEYISKISEQFPLSEFVKPTEGLHINIKVENGSISDKEIQSELYQPRKGEANNLSDFILNDCLSREMHLHYINSNKAISDKKIHSASPYGLMVKKQSLEDNGWMKNWRNNIEIYFRESLRKTKAALTEDEYKIVNAFIIFIIERLPKYLITLQTFQSLKATNYIIVYLGNFTIQSYKILNDNYFADNLFNKNDYNTKVREDTYGLSDYHNGDNIKKPYLKHLTSPFLVNNRIPQNQALLLNTFENYRRAGAFKTNPLIIFIYNEELNNEVVDIVQRNGTKVSFHHLMHTLFGHQRSDLGNYYLLYFLGPEIKDLDFVSSFKYELDIKIRHVIPEPKPDSDKTLTNIFQFEYEILQPIFNNQLIQKRADNSIGYKYFEDIDYNPKYNITEVIWQLVLRYRKAFYDFIYKSERQAVNSTMFYDIMKQSILDDIRHDKIQNNFHTKTDKLITKFNIWFSLWGFFQNNSNTNNLAMSNKIIENQERMRAIRDKENEHVQTDEEFAFASGQVIYYLLSKSKSANLTHAALEPFLQKTDLSEFKKAIVNTFNAYKHEIEFRQGRFEKLCSETLKYELTGNLKDLIPFILAGYFSKSLIYEKTKN
jgi:CRISPR-associated protein Csh1